MKKRICCISGLALAAVLFTAVMLSGAARGETSPSGAVLTVTSASKPLVVWYSRTGTSQLVAETLQKQLGCDRVRIPSTKDRGIFSIVQEQFFDGKDDQQKFPRDLAPFNPVIIAAPIYFMQLSAPARAFMELNRDALKGKELYLFVTLGGRLSEGKIQTIKDFGTGLGLTIKEVFSLQTGKKEEFPERISALLKTVPLHASAAP